MKDDISDKCNDPYGRKKRAENAIKKVFHEALIRNNHMIINENIVELIN